jgi:hypothetical protein
VYPPGVDGWRPCHCLCAVAHPLVSGVCAGHDAVTSRRVRTRAAGPVDIPLCGPCAVAQGQAVDSLAAALAAALEPLAEQFRQLARVVTAALAGTGARAELGDPCGNPHPPFRKPEP